MIAKIRLARNRRLTLRATREAKLTEETKKESFCVSPLVKVTSWSEKKVNQNLASENVLFYGNVLLKCK